MVFDDEGVYVLIVACAFPVGFGACGMSVVPGPCVLKVVLCCEVAGDGYVDFEVVTFQGKDQVDPVVCVPWRWELVLFVCAWEVELVGEFVVEEVDEVVVACFWCSSKVACVGMYSVWVKWGVACSSASFCVVLAGSVCGC